MKISNNSLATTVAALFIGLSSFHADGQIRVDQDGHVGLGTVLTSPQSRAYITCTNGESIKSGLYVNGLGAPDWHQCVWVDMDQESAIGFAARFKNTTNWYVVASGWMYSQGSYIGSDANIKTNIQEIENPTSMLNSINGYRYNYTTEHLEEMGLEENPNMVGVLAQEVEKVLPWAVQENEVGIKSVNYDAIIPILIEVVQEQNAKIERLEATIQSNGALNTESNQDEKLQQIQFYPNPASTTVTINHGTNNREGAEVKVFDLTGKQVMSTNVTQNENETVIDVNNLDNGMYIFSVIQNGNIIADQRVVISH